MSICSPEALGIDRGQLIAFVGGGGKTTAILTLLQELRDQDWRVIASTTTLVGRSFDAVLPIVEGDPVAPTAITEALDRSGAAFVTAGRRADGKLVGVTPQTLDDLVASGAADAILVEADGARQRPLKAPAGGEPVVPDSAHIVVPVVGLDALGKPIEPAFVHRHELVRLHTDSAIVDSDLIVELVTSSRGGMKGVPPEAAVRPLLNKVHAAAQHTACLISESILHRRPKEIDRVLVADIRTGRFAFVERREVTA